MARSDADKWREAAQTEIDALTANDTWELVVLPEGRKPIGSRWVFLIKRDAHGQVEQYKAQLVGQGYGKSHGIDYNKVFAPTTQLASL